MSGQVLAYHMTIGTHGSRLHGDERGTVDRRHNEYATPFLDELPAWQERERQLLKSTAAVLTDNHREAVERLIPGVCQRGGWMYHIAGCQPDHVHVLLSADFEPKRVRRWFKTWLTEELTVAWPERTAWWAECGSTKYIWDERYFNQVYEYIRQQRFTPGAEPLP